MKFPHTHKNVNNRTPSTFGESLEQREREGNRGKNRMGKSRDLFKKIGDIKGTFHARMCMIKDSKGKDLTDTEEIKKRWQE